MNTLSDSLMFHAQATRLREMRGQMLASNLANAATPGFQARDFDFGAALAEATGNGTLSATDSRHFGTSGPTPLRPGWRVPTEASLDGNTVEPAIEQTEFADNALRHQISLMLLNRRIDGLRNAIRGE